ncbi:metal-dependent hydrolase [Clostridium novyi]|uniref:metal-dependent hydrolase n=1 Tax=Clostridium novyi TaxID=1542 RepID=UPI00057D886F|nr:metal-dependent hydrolase [Clostridium novyi]
MLRKTHLATGLAATSIFMRTPKDFLIVALFTALGSLMPDIDAPAASIFKRLEYISYLVILSFIYIFFSDKVIPFISLAILTVFAATRKHRTFTHSILSMLAFTACITFISVKGTIFFTAGYGLHLICDSLTVMGVPVFYPFVEKRFSFNMMKTGSKEDRMLGALCMLIFFGIIAI